MPKLDMGVKKMLAEGRLNVPANILLKKKKEMTQMSILTEEATKLHISYQGFTENH